MPLNPGDHICAIYDSDDELTDIIGDFLDDSGVRSLPVADPATVTSKLEQLKAVGAEYREQVPVQPDGRRRTR